MWRASTRVAGTGKEQYELGASEEEAEGSGLGEWRALWFCCKARNSTQSLEKESRQITADTFAGTLFPGNVTYSSLRTPIEQSSFWQCGNTVCDRTLMECSLGRPRLGRRKHSIQAEQRRPRRPRKIKGIRSFSQCACFIRGHRGRGGRGGGPCRGRQRRTLHSKQVGRYLEKRFYFASWLV